MSANRRIGAEVFVKATEAKSELDTVSKKVENVGTAAEKSNKAAAVAANGLASAQNAAAAATGSLLFRQQQVSQEITRVNAAIKAESVSLDLMSRVSARSADAQGILSTKIKEAQGSITGLLLQKRSLADQAGELNKKIEATANGTGKSAEGFNRLTTQVRTNGTVFQGWDGILQATLGSIGGVTVATSIFISLAGALLPKLLNLSDAKKELISLSTEEISTNLLIAQSYEALSNKAIIAAQGFFSFEQNARSVAEAGIAINLLNIADAQQKVEKEAQKITFNYQLLQKEQELLNAGISGGASRFETWQEAIQDSALALAEQQKKLSDNLDTMRILRDVYGFSTQQLIEFAKRGGASQTAIDAMTRALNSDIVQLRLFSDELVKATSRTFNMEQAALRLSIALQQIKPPNLNMDFLRGMNEDPNERIQRAIGTAAGGFKTGPPTSQQLFGAIQPELKDIREQFRQTAAAMAGTKEETKRLYDEQVNRLHPSYREQIQLLDKSSENMKAFTESKRSGAGAARAAAAAAKGYANELSQLTKRIQEAQAALVADNFASREAKINADILAEARAAVIKKNFAAANRAEITKMDTLQEVAALGVKLGLNKKYFDDLATLQSLLNQKVSQGKTEAERQSNVALQRMQIELIKDEKTRRDLNMRLDIQDYIRSEEEKFGITEESLMRIDLFRQILEAQFNEWLLQEQRSNWAKQRQARIDEEKKFYDEARKLAIELGRDTRREQQQLAEGVGRKLGFDIGGATVTPEQRRQVEEIIKQMNELHITLRLIEGDYSRDAREAQRFMSSLRVLQAFSKGDILGGLRASLAAVRSSMLDVQSMTDILAGAFESAFSSIGQSGTSFLRSLAASLINGIAQVVAGVLSQIGTMLISKGLADIAMGIAISANPFTPGAGAGLIAAGHHEVLVGGALKLLGGIASGLGAFAAGAVQGNGGGAGGDTGSGAASSSPSGSRERSAPPTTRLPVSSGANSRSFSLHLDRQGTQDFLDGKEVLTADNIRNQQKTKFKSAVKAIMRVTG
jgi:hypothetical protein